MANKEVAILPNTLENTSVSPKSESLSVLGGTTIVVPGGINPPFSFNLLAWKALTIW